MFSVSKVFIMFRLLSLVLVLSVHSPMWASDSEVFTPAKACKAVGVEYVLPGTGEINRVKVLVADGCPEDPKQPYTIYIGQKNPPKYKTTLYHGEKVIAAARDIEPNSNYHLFDCDLDPRSVKTEGFGRAVGYAIKHGIKVINWSAGMVKNFDPYDPQYYDLDGDHTEISAHLPHIKLALEKGKAITVSFGNKGEQNGRMRSKKMLTLLYAVSHYKNARLFKCVASAQLRDGTYSLAPSSDRWVGDTFEFPIDISAERLEKMRSLVVVAPGDRRELNFAGKKVISSGTSFAAPTVLAVFAKLLNLAGDSLPPLTVMRFLEDGASKSAFANPDDPGLGLGMVNYRESARLCMGVIDGMSPRPKVSIVADDGTGAKESRCSSTTLRRFSQERLMRRMMLGTIFGIQAPPIAPITADPRTLSSLVRIISAAQLLHFIGWEDRVLQPSPDSDVGYERASFSASNLWRGKWSWG